MLKKIPVGDFAVLKVMAFGKLVVRHGFNAGIAGATRSAATVEPAPH